jgi:hypothetical protein
LSVLIPCCCSISLFCFLRLNKDEIAGIRNKQAKSQAKFFAANVTMISKWFSPAKAGNMKDNVMKTMKPAITLTHHGKKAKI